ncbi:MAG TPA: hypothetical protein VEU75_05720, partial [Candidatus Acidoferrum sp.]|nr:hypothetical protein [Candidatus Acidoferrum sp.]
NVFFNKICVDARLTIATFAVVKKYDRPATFREVHPPYLSFVPGYAGGRRAEMLWSDRAQFDLAKRLRNREDVTIAEVFTFLSGLYFRRKIAYANAFACCPDGNQQRVCDHARAWTGRCAQADSDR